MISADRIFVSWIVPMRMDWTDEWVIAFWSELRSEVLGGGRFAIASKLLTIRAQLRLKQRD